jgi:hypothetical protein
MNAPNTPLPPGTLDELLSADLDGELERAAADHGLPLDDARAALAEPDAVARRAALARARDLVVPAVPLHPADADRLVAGALERAREENEIAAARRRRNRVDAGRRVAIAAASIVVVFGGIAVLARGTTSSSSGGSKSSAAARPALRSSPAPESRSLSLGDVSTDDALRAKVGRRLAGRRPSVPGGTEASPPDFSDNTAKSAAPGAVNSSPEQLAPFSLIGPKGPRGLPGHESAADRATLAVGPSPTDCVDRLVQGGRVPLVPVFSGTGAVRGRPVYVAVFARNASYDVYVLRAADCSVLRRAVV